MSENTQKSILENIENIMQQYFYIKNINEQELNKLHEEQEKINESIDAIKKNREKEKSELTKALEYIRENKEKDISSYIETMYLTDINTPESYVESIRKDLEETYKAQEQKLESDIQALNEKTEEEINATNELKDLRLNRKNKQSYEQELQTIEIQTLKKLLDEKSRLESKLKDEDSNFQLILYFLAQCKQKYKEQQCLANNQEYYDLNKKFNICVKNKEEIRKCLLKIDEYLKLFELNIFSKVEEIKDEIKPFEPANRCLLDDILEINDPVEYNIKKEGTNVIADTSSDLVQMVYTEVVNEVPSIESVKLSKSKKYLSDSEYYFSESIGDSKYNMLGKVDLGDGKDSIIMPSGQYINYDDFEKGLDVYYKKNKNNTYEIISAGKKLEMTEKTLIKCKAALKKCSTIRLQKNSSLFSNVYGKEQENNLLKINKEKSLGILDGSIEDGNYISRNESIFALRKLFK